MFAVVGALGISLVAANEKPSAAMMEIMKSNAALNAEVRAAAKAMDYAKLTEAAGTFQANYAYIDAFFTAKKVDAAATIARGGLEAAKMLEMASMKQDAAMLTKAVAGVTGTCGACHKEFREQLADKTYEIKLP
jgi:cytochrome c556